MAIYQYDGHRPQLHDDVYVAEDATLIGKVALGQGASVWPQAVLRGDNETIEIGAGSLIGIQSVILNGAVIGRNCLVGAGSLVPEGKVYPDNSLILGVPAKVVRELDAAAIEAFQDNARDYVERARTHKRSLIRIA